MGPIFIPSCILINISIIIIQKLKNIGRKRAQQFNLKRLFYDRWKKIKIRYEIKCYITFSRRYVLSYLGCFRLRRWLADREDNWRENSSCINYRVILSSRLFSVDLLLLGRYGMRNSPWSFFRCWNKNPHFPFGCRAFPTKTRNLLPWAACHKSKELQ